MLLLIYLVLAAQFESFLDPFTIMITVPLALAGALLSLWIFGQTLNIFSQIGMILLIGLVTKNDILIVEFANQLQRDGLSKFEAIRQGASVRLRPVLMTALVASLGFVPMAFNSGTGAEVQRPLATVVIGSIISATLLTLVLLPALYKLVNRKAR